MKQKALTIILVMTILMAITGCQTKNGRVSKDNSYKFLFQECLKLEKIDDAKLSQSQKSQKESCQEIMTYYYKWRDIDEKNLSSRDRQRLKELNEQIEQYGFQKVDKRYIAFFPWIDLQRLTNKDKLFLLRIGDEFAAAAGAADVH